MSPHLGTHTDAPSHISKKLSKENGAGSLPLAPFIGPCMVVDLSPCHGQITVEHFKKALKTRTILPRVLMRSSSFTSFAKECAYLSVDLIHFLHEHQVILVGIDTPSVDFLTSKSLEVHHALVAHHMLWLENLNLSSAAEEEYFLSALPIKLMELEAAPVRAVLLPPLYEGIRC